MNNNQNEKKIMASGKKCGGTRSLAGFTLIEISIVIVIIGLLVGGVLVGRDLIKSAEIRSQITQIEKFKIATNTFKLKYGSLPGDMPPDQAAANGFFTFIGNDAGKSTADKGSAYGDNDGRINSNWNGAGGEIYVFWQHLSEAKLIEGQYGGTPTGDHLSTNASDLNSVTIIGGRPVNSSNTALSMNTQAQDDKFLPRQKLTSSIGNVIVYPTLWRDDIAYIQNRKSFNNFFYTAGTANEAYAIDKKIDDGKPLTGNVLEDMTDIEGGYYAPCTKDNGTEIIYDPNITTSDTASCLPVFLW